jgi:hypothetical protein
MFRTLHRMARIGFAAVVAGGLTVTGVRAEPAKPAKPVKPTPVGVTPVKPLFPKIEPPKMYPPLPSAPKPAGTRPDPLDLRGLPLRVGDVRPDPRAIPVDAFPTDRARFRVQLLGFHCTQQTRDDRLENDGAGDEVILRAWTRVLDGEAVVTNQSSGPRGIFAADDHHGDAFQRFIRAGTANRDHGGIASGNDVLADGSPGVLPVTVFEGTLIAGRSVAVIVPTLWEWDDFCGDAPERLSPRGPFPTQFWTTDPRHENDRLSAFESAMGSLTRTDRVSRLARSYVTAAADARADRSGHDLDLPSVRGDMGGNRGIGAVDTGDGIVFQPRAVVLNFAIANRLADAGGEVRVWYFDEGGDLNGCYTVTLRVERLP